MATIYDMMQPCKLPGAITTVTWSPRRISNRMKKMVERLILTDRLGSWSSGSWQITRSLYDHHDLPFYRTNGVGYVYFRLPVGDQTVAELMNEALVASATADRLNGNRHWRNAPWLHGQVSKYATRLSQFVHLHIDADVANQLQRDVAHHYAHRRDADNATMLATLNSTDDIVIAQFQR